eukprot:GSA25T00015450001.1
MLLLESAIAETERTADTSKQGREERDEGQQRTGGLRLEESQILAKQNSSSSETRTTWNIFDNSCLVRISGKQKQGATSRSLTTLSSWSCEPKASRFVRRQCKYCDFFAPIWVHCDELDVEQ